MDRFRLLLERRSRIVRLVAGFIVLFLAILLLGIHSILATRTVNRQSSELYRTELLGISHIREAHVDLIATGRELRQMVLAPTFVDRDQARARLDQAMLDVEKEIAAARPSIFRDQEKRLLNDFEQAFEHYKRNVNDAVTLVDASRDYQQKATAYVSGESFNQVGDSVEEMLRRMAVMKENSAREIAMAMATDSGDAQRLTVALLLGGLLSATIIAVLIARFMKQPTDSSYQSIDPWAQEHVDDTAPLSCYRDEVVVEECCEPVAGSHDASIRRPSMLVVQNSGSSREVTASLAAHTDCKVTVANSGQEAVELLKKSPYDVVLMNMDLMNDGIDATLEIRENSAFDTVPIIALAANGIHRDMERCLAAGIDGHIAKSISPDELFRALMCWMTDDTQYADGSTPIALASRPGV